MTLDRTGYRGGWTGDPTDAVILSVLKATRRTLKARELIQLLPVQMGERAAQKRLKGLELQQLINRPRGMRSGWSYVH